jgi:hypothetical protein
VQSVLTIYYPMSQVAATRVTGLVNMVVTSVLLCGVIFIVIGSASKWLTLLKTREVAALGS